MAGENFKLVQAKDAVYALNAYLALNGLQRFQSRYQAKQVMYDEIGNAVHTDISTEPETSGSFEVTDTASIASIFARMRYDYSTQAYMAGALADMTSNTWTFTENDLQFMVFDMIQQKAPGGSFTEAKLIPNAFLTRFGIRLTNDGTGSASFEFQGNLQIPVYKPYQKVSSYPCVFATGTTITVPAGWSANSGTHGILGGMVNNVQLAPTDIAFTGSTTITLQASGVTKITTFDTDDRIMVWLYARTPGNEIAIDYPTSVKFVKADRVDIWLVPSGTAVDNTNRLLRVQSMDVSAEIPRDELKEILANDNKTSTFFWAPKYPLNFTANITILSTTLHKYAELQGKTPNESGSVSVVDANNYFDVTSWIDAKIVVQWYKYGSSSPLQRFTLSRVKIVGHDETLSVGGRAEQSYSLQSDGAFLLEGLAT